MKKSFQTKIKKTGNIETLRSKPHCQRVLKICLNILKNRQSKKAKKKQIWKSEQKERDWLTKSVNGSELNTFFKSDDLIITYNVLFWVFLRTCIADRLTKKKFYLFFRYGLYCLQMTLTKKFHDVLRSPGAHLLLSRDSKQKRAMEINVWKQTKADWTSYEDYLN